LLASTGAEVPADETIVVTAPATEERVLPPATVLGREELVARQPASLGDALRSLPGVSARTNSRGETIARVRGADERQTQVFLDGAPLAVPWDGRADIGVLPAALFGEVRVVKGAAPIEYGANAVAGAVDLRTRSGADLPFEAIARAGSHGLGEVSVVAGVPLGGGFSALGAAALLTRDAFADARRDGGRINTDLDSLTLFGALQYAGDRFTGRALLFRNEAERGIAPETTGDPALVNPRFWRYPHIALTQLVLAGEFELGGGSSVRAVAWRQWFEQTIDQYGDATYAARTQRQEDEDDTNGARLTLSAGLDPIVLRLSGTAQTSLHQQVDTRFPAAPGPELRYRQNLFSLGAEADIPIGPADATLGIAYDRAETPLTGDKPGQPPLDAIAFSGAVRARLTPDLRLTVSGGRRTRFPTARELFGEALGRFLINPDLDPETAWLADAELSWRRPGLRLSLNPFVVRSEDTLAQRVVVVDGRSLRQRYNLSGSWSYGVDAALDAPLGAGFSLEAHASLLRARADEGAVSPRRLLQRPSHELGAALVWSPSDAISARAEIRHVGPAIDSAADGSTVRLDPAAEINLRASGRIVRLGSGRSVHVTAAADNITDAEITPQLGLPLPGRTFRVGIRIE
jgi:iron complex outermembrane receptor protein